MNLIQIRRHSGGYCRAFAGDPSLFGLLEVPIVALARPSAERGAQVSYG